MGSIPKVEQGIDPRWISPAIFLEKKDEGCRRVVNFKALNNKCERDPNTTLNVLKLASQVPSSMDTDTRRLYFTVLDAWNGYHSIGPSTEATNYFGFSTEWGTYTIMWLHKGT